MEGLRDVMGGVGGQREEGLRDVMGGVGGQREEGLRVQGGGEECEGEGRNVRGEEEQRTISTAHQSSQDGW